MPKTRACKKKDERSVSTGQYTTHCCALYHDDESNTCPRYSLKSGKRIKKDTISKLLQNGIITNLIGHICSGCVNKAELLYGPPEAGHTKECLNTTHEAQNNNDEEDVSDDFDFELVGKKLGDIIDSDIATLYNDKPCANLQNVVDYTPTSWLRDRPRELVMFLENLCRVNVKNDDKRAFLIAKCIEQIYCTRNQRLVLPIGFRENLLTYSLSNSRTLVTYNSSTSPGGSYSYLKSWLAAQSSSPLEVPSGVIRSVLDNEQVIGKRYHVRSDNRVPQSVITSHAYLSINKESDIQNNDKYSPSRWLFLPPNKEQITRIISFPTQFDDIFRISRNSFISERLKSVLREQNLDPSHTCAYTDCVDLFLLKQETSLTEKTCVDCHAPNDPTYRRCTNCKGGLTREKCNPCDVTKNSVDPYSHFRDVPVEQNNITVQVGEPDMSNPNSFVNISSTLQNLGDRAGICRYGDQSRQWLFMEVDGGIYNIVDKLALNVMFCSKCNESYYGQNNFEEHRCHIMYHVEPQHEFDWIVLMPGLLHFEMNAARSFMGLNWEIMMEEVVKGLGFTSIRALQFIRKGSDHHKLWEICQILYIGLTDELLLPFVRHCLTKGCNPTVDGFWEWCSDLSDPNYLFMHQMALTFLHALMLLRTGVRRGNIDSILAAKAKIILLFFARNHPRYQQIVSRDIFIQCLMPEELRTLMYSSMSLSRTGNIGHYQGGDACLEEINKEAKTWITGVPTHQQWLRTFRNLDKLKKIRSTTLDQAGVKDPKTPEKTKQHVGEAEILQVRALFRRNKYLINPSDSKPHCDITGRVILQDDLVSFTSSARDICTSHLEAMVENKVVKQRIIYITAEEKQKANSINSLSKADIKKRIFEVLDMFCVDERQLYEEYFIKSVRSENKDVYVRFYYEMTQKVDNDTEETKSDEDE